MNAFGAFVSPCLCKSWSWMLQKNMCLWTVWRVLWVIDSEMVAWRAPRCLEVENWVEIDPKSNPKSVPKCFRIDPRASLIRSWGIMRVSWCPWARSWAPQVGCCDCLIDFWSSKSRVWKAKSTKKGVQNSNQNVMSFGDCFWDAIQRILVVKMRVVPSSFHVEVNTCLRRAASEKHRKNRC